MIKAVFFDRDGTLTYGNKAIHDRMYAYIIERTKNAEFGRFENYMYFHKKTSMAVGAMLTCNTKQKEDIFWQTLFEYVFEEYNSALDFRQEAEKFLKLFPQHKLNSIFPEVKEVLEVCKAKNMYLGIISDCGPYLEDSIVALGIDSYFKRYIASSEIGAMKPDPAIFSAAIKGLDISPSECMFIDDTLEEANGAREFGFLSFHIDRRNKTNIKKKWEISDLKEILSYL